MARVERTPLAGRSGPRHVLGRLLSYASSTTTGFIGRGGRIAARANVLGLRLLFYALLPPLAALAIYAGVGKENWRLPAYAGRIASMALSPEGDLAAVGRENGEVEVWSVSTSPRIIRSVSSQAGAPVEVSLDRPAGHDIRLIYSTAFGSLQIQSAASGAPLADADAFPQSVSPQKFIVTADSALWVAGISEIGTPWIGRLANGARTGRVLWLGAEAGGNSRQTDGPRSVFALMPARAGRAVSLVDDTGAVFPVDADTAGLPAIGPAWKDKVDLNGDGEPKLLGVFDGESFSVSGGYQRGLLSDGIPPQGYVLQPLRGTEGEEITDQRDGTEAVFSPDGRYMIAWGANPGADVFDLEARRKVGRIFSDMSIVGDVAFKNSRPRAIGYGKDGTITVRDENVQKPVSIVILPAGVSYDISGLAPDGSRFVVTFGPKDKQGNIDYARATSEIRDAVTDKLLWKLPYAVDRVSFSPDSRLIVTLPHSRQTIVRIWDAETGKLVAGLDTHSAQGFGTAHFSPDGARVISASADGKVRIWNLANREMSTFSVGKPLLNAALSPDGSEFVTNDSTQANGLHIWNVAANREIGRYPHKAGIVSTAAFSRKNRRLFFWADGVPKFLVRCPSTEQESEGQIFDPASGFCSDKQRLPNAWSRSSRAMVESFSFFKSGPRLEALIGLSTGEAVLLAMPGGELLARYAGSRSAVTNISVSSDGHTAMLAKKDGSIQIVKLRAEHLPLFAGFDQELFALESEVSAMFTVRGEAGKSTEDTDFCPICDKTAGLTQCNKCFDRPVDGDVILGYGDSDRGERNDGINIAAERDTPVRAAADGVVVYAGNDLRGYGNVILIQHDAGYLTVYAHAASMSVERGQHVSAREVIGTVGQTGDVDQPQLHFEIRRNSAPIDPQLLLQ